MATKLIRMTRRDTGVAVTRRAWLGGAATAVVAIVGAAACKGEPLVCDGLPSVAPADVPLRKTLEYVDTSPQPERACDGCTFYTAPSAPDTCGGCKVVRGPIHPKGTCKLFAKKPEGAPAT